MGYCSKCAAEVDAEASFCHKCGTPVKKESKSADIEPDIYKTSLKKELVYGKVDLEDIEKGYEIDGRYVVEEKIGQGGFGAVYKVSDKSLATKKALKVLPSTIINDREAMELLRNEASTMAKLNHPNIVRIYDFHENGKIKYIDMEFVDGKNLTDIKLDSVKKRLAEEEVKKYADQIAKGLLYAHSKNVIHKDIKPQNILVSKEKEIKIMDFGISETVRTSMSRLDNTGTSGTLVYMSPEQIMGENVGKESDIYSYGVLLYELLTGTPPFTRGAIEHQILNKEPDSIEGISKELNSIIIKCLKKDYKERFKDFDEVLKVLSGEKEISEFEKRFSGEEINKELKNKERRKNKAVIIAASILLIIAIGSAAVFFTGNKLKKTDLKSVKTIPVGIKKTSSENVEKPGKVKSEIEETKEKIIVLKSEIDWMKKRIDSGKAKDGDSLEHIYELVSKKSHLLEKLASLKKAEKERRISQIKKDIKRYKRVVESKEGKGLENAAWQSLIKKYPGISVGVVKGDTKALLSGARLYIKTEPENADIKILNINHRYFSGIKIARGKYTISVKAEGYSGKKINIDIDSEKDIHKKVSLVQFPKVYIKTKPENARITIMGTKDKYFPGMMLEPKEYTIKASAKDYEEKIFKINLEPGKKLNKNVKLTAFGRLTVISDPPGTDIKILNIKEKYYDGIKLKKGSYKLSIKRKGYFSLNKTVYLKPGENKKEKVELKKGFINSTGMKFVYIKPGTFMMGSPSSESGRGNDEKEYKVTLTKGYFMQTTEVTQGQWKKIMGDNPSRFKNCGDNCPVERVSWKDARKFIKKLNKMDKDYKYSLPTEAQWEYAARAGSKGKYAGSSLSSMGWYSSNSGVRTHVVGKKKPNAWGLYDMHGNAWEWCEDWYGDYPSGHVTDPAGPSSGSHRVHRGCSWNDFAWFCRSANRDYNSPGNTDFDLGFRVAASRADR